LLSFRQVCLTFTYGVQSFSFVFLLFITKLKLCTPTRLLNLIIVKHACRKDTYFEIMIEDNIIVFKRRWSVKSTFPRWSVGTSYPLILMASKSLGRRYFWTTTVILEKLFLALKGLYIPAQGIALGINIICILALKGRYIKHTDQMSYVTPFQG